MARSTRSGNSGSQRAGPSAPQDTGSSVPAQQQGGNAPTSGNSNNPGGNVNPPSTGSNASATPNKFDLPFLEDDGDNYNLWSRALTLALRNRKFWPIVNGTELAPDEATDPAGYEDWCDKDQQAQLMILLTLKKVGQQCIFEAETAKECWDALNERYSNGSNQRKVALLEQLLVATFSDTEPLQPQLDAIRFAARQLESTGFRFPDAIVAYLIIFRLPPSYDMTRAVLTSSESPRFSSKWVADQIIAEEHRRISQSGNTATVFFAKARENKSERGKCFYCKKPGHRQSECRRKKKDEENNGTGNKSNTSETSNSAGSSASTTTTTKANVAVTEDDLVVLLDPSNPPTAPHIYSFLAWAQDDATRLLEPSPASLHDDLPFPDTEDYIDLTDEEDIDEDHPSTDRDRAPAAQVQTTDIEHTGTQTDNASDTSDRTSTKRQEYLEQALVDGLQQVSELGQLLKTILERPEVQAGLVDHVDHLHDGKGKYASTMGTPAHLARRHKAGRRLRQSRTVIFDEGGPKRNIARNIEHISALISGAKSTQNHAQDRADAFSQSPSSAPRGATMTYSSSHDTPANSSTPTATVTQKLADEGTSFATQAKTVTRLNAEASEDERRPHTTTETQKEKTSRIIHALDVGIPSRAARAVAQGDTQIEDASHAKSFAPAAKFRFDHAPTNIHMDDWSTITVNASETHKTQGKTKRVNARMPQGVNRPV